LGSYDDAGHSDQIVKTAMAWSAAKAWAESQSGHLASIIRASGGGGASYLWPRGLDADVEGTWRWGDGTLASLGSGWIA
jgi:hypothetical protein